MNIGSEVQKMITFMLNNELFCFNEDPDVEYRLENDDDYAREFLSNRFETEIGEFERVEIEQPKKNIERYVLIEKNDFLRKDHVEDNFKTVLKWEDPAVQIFLEELAKNKDIMRKGATKSQRVYQKIAKALQAAGYKNIKIVDCQNKMKSLLATYRRNVARRNSGSATSSWEYFDAMDEIFRTRARICIPNENLVDSLDDEFRKSCSNDRKSINSDPLDLVDESQNNTLVVPKFEVEHNDEEGNHIEEQSNHVEEEGTSTEENNDDDYISTLEVNDNFTERFLKLTEERNDILREILNVLKSKV